MSDPDLLLHLALDELQGIKLYDASDAKRNAINHGASIVEDDGFGSCLELKGAADSYVELPAFSSVLRFAQPMTIMIWTRLTALDRSMCLLDLEYSAKNRFTLYLQRSSNGELLLSTNSRAIGGGDNVDYRFTDPRMRQIGATWFHLAFVINQQRMDVCYINGRPINEFQVGATGKAWGNPGPPGSEGAGSASPSSYLGKFGADNTDSTAPLQGRLAQFRVYSRALTHEEISWDMEGDRPVQYRYRITHPIDFSLENRDADPVLFMDGHPDGQTMTLRVNNVTGGVVQLAPLPDAAPSVTNCHFELAFRPGALENNSAAKVTLSTPDSPWKIASKSWTAPDDRDSLYLLCTRPGPLPDGGLTLELRRMLPDSRYGTRTTLVDLRYRNLKSGAGETISGSVQQNLDLVNHQGRRNIPLHVGFTGSNTVLNNADKTTTLRLRVTNVLFANDVYDDPSKASGSGVLRFGEKSEFLLSLDERPGTDWALNEPDRVREIVVRYAKGPVTPTSPTATQSGGTQGKPWQWTIPLKDLSLGPEEYLELQLENVRASGSDGHSNLYLDYRDIPGYWNGRFTTVIEKAPLVYRNGKVGIGVLDPKANLEVKGTIKADSLIVSAPPAIKKIDLANGWKVADEKTPRYFKDSLGMVHFMGQCYYTLPADPKAKAAWLDQSQTIFTLPAECSLTSTYQFRFPARAWLQVADAPDSWHLLYINGYTASAEAHVAIYSVRHKLSQSNGDEVHVFLDGVSYLARG
jgi:hypothetical protein